MSKLACYLKRADSKRKVNVLSFSLDAYARVAFCKQSGITEVMTQTLSPTWDQTLIFDDIEIYEGVDNVANNPPRVVVELFDKDAVVIHFNFCAFIRL